MAVTDSITAGLGRSHSNNTAGATYQGWLKQFQWPRGVRAGDHLSRGQVEGSDLTREALLGAGDPAAGSLLHRSLLPPVRLPRPPGTACPSPANIPAGSKHNSMSCLTVTLHSAKTGKGFYWLSRHTRRTNALVCCWTLGHLQPVGPSSLHQLAICMAAVKTTPCTAQRHAPMSQKCSPLMT